MSEGTRVLKAVRIDGLLHVVLADGNVFFLRDAHCEVDDETLAVRHIPDKWIALPAVPGTAAAARRSGDL